MSGVTLMILMCEVACWLQMLANTKALWYLGGKQGTIAQLQNQDPSIASIPAVRFPAALWK